MRSVVVQPEAGVETDEAFVWYEGCEPGLGFRFLHELEVRYAAIARQPERFKPVGRGFRRALIRVFPYAIFFECDDDLVIVHSIFHCSRNPAEWRRRLARARKES